MLNSDDLYPWPLGIMVYQGEYSSEWHLILAFVTLTILPTIILFLFAQNTSSPGRRRERSRAELSHQPTNSNGSKRSLHEKSRHRRHRLRRHQQGLPDGHEAVCQFELRRVADMRSAAAEARGKEFGVPGMRANRC